MIIKGHQIKVIYFSVIVLVSLQNVYGSHEIDEQEKESSDSGSSSEREVLESAIYFTERSTVLTTTTDVYFGSNAPVGPLYNFMVNLCKVLINNFSNSRLPEYFAILSRSLKHLGSGYLMRKLVKRFSRALYKMSAFRGKFLKMPVDNFLQMITENKPKRRSLFFALNLIFTASLDRKMDDYIYQLKRYGTRKIKHIAKWTKKVFDYVIFYTISKQEEPVKRDILVKFNLAVLEYYKK